VDDLLLWVEPRSGRPGSPCRLNRFINQTGIKIGGAGYVAARAEPEWRHDYSAIDIAIRPILSFASENKSRPYSI
jgi:hypothetical protein